MYPLKNQEYRVRRGVRRALRAFYASQSSTWNMEPGVIAVSRAQGSPGHGGGDQRELVRRRPGRLSRVLSARKAACRLHPWPP